VTRGEKRKMRVGEGAQKLIKRRNSEALMVVCQQQEGIKKRTKTGGHWGHEKKLQGNY